MLALVVLTLILWSLLTKLMKNISKYILYAVIGLAGIALGVFGSKLFSKCKAETVYVPGEVVVKDTCLDNRLLCTITTKDSMNIYRIIKEGLKVHEPKQGNKPKIEEVKVPDTPYAEPILERIYTKILNNGIVEVYDTLKIRGEILDWDRAYKVNETVEVQEKITNTTAVIEKGEDNSETIKYLPVEVPRKKETWVGLGTSFKYNDKFIPDAGIFVERGKTSVGLFVDPLQGFNDLSSYRVQLNQKLLRIGSK